MPTKEESTSGRTTTTPVEPPNIQAAPVAQATKRRANNTTTRSGIPGDEELAPTCATSMHTHKCAAHMSRATISNGAKHLRAQNDVCNASIPAPNKDLPHASHRPLVATSKHLACLTLARSPGWRKAHDLLPFAMSVATVAACPTYASEAIKFFTGHASSDKPRPSRYRFHICRSKKKGRASMAENGPRRALPGKPRHVRAPRTPSPIVPDVGRWRAEAGGRLLIYGIGRDER